MKMKQFLFIIIILSLLAIFAMGCNGKIDGVTNVVPDKNSSDYSNNKPGNSSSGAETEKRVLTIAQWRSDLFGLDIAIDNFKRIYPDVDIILKSSDGDLDKHKQQMYTQLMAGNGADIMEATGLRDIKIYESGYLADYYTLMQNDPGFNEDDYYMNVFAGLEHQNKLYIFPSAFRYDVVAINNTISAELTNSFEQYDTITYRQMLDIYNGLTDHSELYINSNIDAITAIDNNLMTFVDFANKTCSFNSEYFINFIKDLKKATNPQKKEEGQLGTYWRGDYSKTKQEEYALQYLFLAADICGFLSDTTQPDTTQLLTTDSELHAVYYPYAEKEVFTHFVPITDDNGCLIIMPSRSFCINEASENKELAWDFVKFMSTPDANQNNHIRNNFPVYKKFFESQISKDLMKYVDLRRNSLSGDDSTEQIVEQIMTLLERYNEMPMKYQVFFSTGGGPAYDMIVETMTNYYNNILTAEQAASELQNKISLYLME